MVILTTKTSPPHGQTLSEAKSAKLFALESPVTT